MKSDLGAATRAFANILGRTNGSSISMRHFDPTNAHEMENYLAELNSWANPFTVTKPEQQARRVQKQRQSKKKGVLGFVQSVAKSDTVQNMKDSILEGLTGDH